MSVDGFADVSGMYGQVAWACYTEDNAFFLPARELFVFFGLGRRRWGKRGIGNWSDSRDWILIARWLLSWTKFLSLEFLKFMQGLPEYHLDWHWNGFLASITFCVYMAGKVPLHGDILMVALVMGQISCLILFYFAFSVVVNR